MIHYTHQEDRRPGQYATGVVLCLSHLGGDSAPYVVWDLYFAYDYKGGSWVAGNGDYFAPDELDRAVERYRERANA